MKKKELKRLIGLKEGYDYGEIPALEFEDTVVRSLERHGHVSRQVWVEDRGDGRGGRIDVVFNDGKDDIAIEIDRKTPRKKSRFKVKKYGQGNAFVITRSPFGLHIP